MNYKNIVETRKLNDKRSKLGRNGDVAIRYIDGEPSHVTALEASLIDSYGKSAEAFVKDVGAGDTEIFVDSTDAYPGSGQIILNKETISYTAKTAGKFSGLTRGVNFNYDQRVILDAGQNDSNGLSTYKFNVGDIAIRAVESANNKIARVYDWDPSTR